MKGIFYIYPYTKVSLIICCVVFCLFITFIYQYFSDNKLIFLQCSLQSMIAINKQLHYENGTSNKKLTFERRTHCNYRQKDLCYSTNKSLVVTFWSKKSIDKWVAQNILSAFPLDSFDHIIFVHDNSSWHSHPGYKHFIWIHVDGQHRLWYLKRFLLPIISVSYEYLWIIDDDAQLNFIPLHYQCVIRNLNISLSAPARLSGVISHSITRLNNDYKDKIGRWTSFIETGPIVVMSSLIWQCIYKYIDAATGTGWGIDLIWCNIIAQECLPLSEREKACAILDVFSVDHQSTHVNSADDGAPELDIYTQTHKTFSTRQQNFGALAENNKLIEFCRR